MSPKFTIGQQVRFLDSPFLQRSVGFLAWVNKALVDKKIFLVEFARDDYITIKDLTNPDWEHEPLSVDLFEAV